MRLSMTIPQVKSNHNKAHPLILLHSHALVATTTTAAAVMGPLLGFIRYFTMRAMRAASVSTV